MFLTPCVYLSLFDLVNDKAKVPPSDEELRNAIVDILKVVDLKTVRIQTSKNLCAFRR